MAGRKMQLEDWLDDLCVRFVINLPQEDLSSVARICFQVEEAQWFYEDFIRPLDPTLPSMSLRTFCLRIFRHCPLLASFPVENHVQAFEEFIQYKTRIPVRGAIMLNAAMDSVVLVKGWKKGASWSFPRGKINKDEDDLDCAIREVYEETGLDLREAGLVPTEARPKYIEIPMRDQHLRLYVIRDVPMDTDFQPRTRKEISKIEWYKLSELPTLRKKGSQNGPNGPACDSSGPAANHNKFYMVAPFLVPLKKWIVSQKKTADKHVQTVVDQSNHHNNPLLHVPIEEDPTEDEAAAVVSKLPAIESLDGATRELQRLLNVQPKAETQPPPENKASALLSLLQPGAASTARPSAPQAPQAPQTPSDLTMTEAGHPRNPHHYTNNVPNFPFPPDLRQPPPSFALLSNQDQASSGWTAAPQGILPASQVYPGYSDYQAPVPAPSAQHHLPPAVSRQQPPLQGQALALLNAFKQGPAAPAPTEPAEQHREPKVEPQQAPQAPASHPAEPQFTSPYSQYATVSGAATGRTEPKSPGELVGSIVGPARQQQHKSALLGLFKAQALPEAPTAPPSEGKEPGTTTRRKVAFDPASLSAEKKLLAQLQLQTASLASTATRDSPHLRKKDKPPSSKPHAAPGISPGHNKTTARSSPRNPTAGATSSPSASASASARNAAKPAPHPTRILQRGQSLQSLSSAEPPVAAVAPKLPDFALFPGSTVSTAAAAAAPAIQPLSFNISAAQPQPQPQSHQAPNYHADVSQEQKRQLLSLFGVAPQVPRQQEPKRAAPSSAAAAAGLEKPISQADQSFLLDYLQSVTNNASGR